MKMDSPKQLLLLIVLTISTASAQTITWADTGFSKPMLSCTLAMDKCSSINGANIEIYAIPGGKLLQTITTSCTSPCIIEKNFISNDGTRSHIYTSTGNVDVYLHSTSAQVFTAAFTPGVFVHSGLKVYQLPKGNFLLLFESGTNNLRVY